MLIASPDYGVVFSMHSAEGGQEYSLAQQIAKRYESFKEKISYKHDDGFYNPRIFLTLGTYGLLSIACVDDFFVVSDPWGLGSPRNNGGEQIALKAHQFTCAYPKYIQSTQKEVREGKLPIPLAEDPFQFCIVSHLKIYNTLALKYPSSIEDLVFEKVTGILESKYGPNSEIEDVHCHLFGTIGWNEVVLLVQGNNFGKMMDAVLAIRELDQSGLGLDCGDENEPIFITSYSTACYDERLSNDFQTCFKSLEEDHGDGKDEKGLLEAFDHDRCNYDTCIGRTPEKECKKPCEGNKGLREKLSRLSGEIRTNARIATKPGYFDWVVYVLQKLIHFNFEKQQRELILGRADINPWEKGAIEIGEFLFEYEKLRYFFFHRSQVRENPSGLSHVHFFTTDICLLLEDHTTQENPELIPQNWEEPVPLQNPEPMIISALKNKGILSKFHWATKAEKDYETGSDTETGLEDIETLLSHGPAFRHALSPYSRNVLLDMFNVFDACICDPFIYETFLDMYPFMQTLQFILRSLTLRVDETFGYTLDFIRRNGGSTCYAEFSTMEELQEYVIKGGQTLPYPSLNDFVEDVFISFARGFRQRYTASYSQIDNEELSAEYRERTHKVLSGFSGFQNLLVNETWDFKQPGFCLLSPRPLLETQKGIFSFMTINFFIAFQPEFLSFLYHELEHVNLRNDQHRPLRKALREHLVSSGRHWAKCKAQDLLQESADVMSKRNLEKVMGKNLKEQYQSTEKTAEETLCDLMLLLCVYGKLPENQAMGNPEVLSDLKECVRFKEHAFYFWLYRFLCNLGTDEQSVLRYLTLFTMLYKNQEDIYQKLIFRPNKQFIQSVAQEAYEILVDAFTPVMKNGANPELTNFFERELQPWFTEHIKQDWLIKPFICLVEFSYFIEDTFNIDWHFEVWVRQVQKANSQKHHANPNKIIREILNHFFRHNVDEDEKKSHRESIFIKEGMLNFNPEQKELRREAFRLRLKLTETLYQESLSWKYQFLKDYRIIEQA